MNGASNIPNIPNLKHLYAGKVRDIYEVDNNNILIVASDRLSAFDVILPTPIPEKGAILNTLSTLWFKRLEHIIPNHLQKATKTLADAIPDEALRAQIQNRAVVARKLKPLPIEAIVRGYIVGSGWKDYQTTSEISGIMLPAGMQLAEKLDSPIFTPSSKAAIGNHDETISFDKVCELIGKPMAKQVRNISLALFKEASEIALRAGIIIADTKFEFGLDENDELVLMDEIFTPDSSRFWPKDEWHLGKNPPSFDKQFVRDYLETLDWDKTAPGPEIPADIIQKTHAKYQEALTLLRAVIAPQVATEK